MNIQNNDIVNHGAAIVIYRCRVACVCVSYYFMSFIDMQRRDRDHEDKLNWDQHQEGIYYKWASVKMTLKFHFLWSTRF